MGAQDIDPSTLDLKDFAALTRSRFYVDEATDAEWYFGNQEVERDLIMRIRTDIDVRSVPKCGVVGRFGIGKTHTLNHLKWRMENDTIGPLANLEPFKLDLPWDETNKEMNSWRYVHARIIDTIGEPFIRTIVRGVDSQASGATDLEDVIVDAAPFGDVNLRRSMATVLVDYFRREVNPRKTYEALQWLKADKSLKQADNLGVTKLLSDSDDMISSLLNLASLWRRASGKGIVLLIDEAQNLGNVKRAETEVHRAFLKLADPSNRDLGFVVAIFGGGLQQIPKVLTAPSDVLSRLGVTSANINEAFIELQKVLRSKQDIGKFMRDVISKLVDGERAKAWISRYNLQDVKQDTFPFTEAALRVLEDALYQREENRNPRITIDKMAVCTSIAYQTTKESGQFVPVTVEMAKTAVASL